MKNLKIMFTILALALATSSQANEPRDYTKIVESSFVQADNIHQIKGSMKIVEKNNEIYLLLGSDFQVTAGPDLKVVLRDINNVTAMIIVAPLQSVSGKQMYKLPLNKDMLSQFNQVMIYCQRFSVNFGFANY